MIRCYDSSNLDADYKAALRHVFGAFEYEGLLQLKFKWTEMNVR